MLDAISRVWELVHFQYNPNQIYFMPMRPAAFKLKYVNLTLTVDFAQIHMETIFFNLHLLQTYMFVYTDASTHVSTLTPIYKHTHVSTYTLSLQELRESILEYL